MNTASRRTGLTILLLAMGVRAAWVLYRWNAAGAALEFPDEKLHWDIANNLVHNQSLQTSDGLFAIRMPLYPAFLAAFAGFGDAGVLAARLAQAVIGGLTAWIVYAFGFAALGRTAGLIAGVLACFDPFAVFTTNLLLTECVFTLSAVGLASATWSLLALHSPSVASRVDGTAESALPDAVAARAALRGDRATIALLALCGVGAVFARQSSVGWVILSWGLLLGSKAGRRCCRPAFVASLAALLLPLLLWGLRNMAVIGAPAYLSSNGGATLYDAVGPQADGSSNQAFLRTLPGLNGLGEADRDRFLTKLSWANIRGNPSHFIGLASVKFMRFWNVVPNVYEYRGGASALVSAAWMLLILAAAFAGLIHAWRRRAFIAVTLLPIAYFTLVHCVYIGSVRYRIPLMPFLELLAAASVLEGRKIAATNGGSARDSGRGFDAARRASESASLNDPNPPR